MPGSAKNVAVAVERLTVAAYKVPTDQPESDGTFAWNSTTLVVVHAGGGGQEGVGYSYTDTAAAHLIHSMLAEQVLGREALDVPAAWEAMVHQVRNLGRPGLCSMAIAAVDNALWDLKARLLGLPLVKLLGAAHDRVPIYGSGGFTSYSVARLREQLGGWASQGIPRVKMKIGTHPADDLFRVQSAREAIGPHVNCLWTPTGPTAASRH
jgi:L-alanine-DL-glutamate epimerase-like enolase superfamily enzyme